MTHTRMSSFLGVLALTAWLSAPTPAQETYLNHAASASYEGGGGCGAPVCDLCDCGGCEDCCEDCCEDTCGTCGGFEPCCHCAGLWAEAELMFFRYHRNDGVDIANRNQNLDLAAEFDFEVTPRFTVGYVRGDGYGARVRYWEFDHDSSTSAVRGAANAFYWSVETYNIDAEVFNTFALNRNWDVEVAFGLRWNEFTEDAQSPNANIASDFNYFSGWGGMASVELRGAIGECGALFVRARHAILMSDAEAAFSAGANNSFTFTDVNQSVTELAIGYQYTVPICCCCGYYFVKTQAEWQTWDGYDRLFFNNSTGAVGFGGFGLSAGIAR